VNTGPSKPIVNLREAAGFLKQLSKASARHFPTTAERLMEIVQLVRRHEAYRDNGSDPEGENGRSPVEAESSQSGAACGNRPTGAA
jgi:hypothetical protein